MEKNKRERTIKFVDDEPPPLSLPPSFYSLSLLETAIFSDNNFRLKYLKLCKEMINKPNGKIEVLLYCWDVLNWRPNVKGNKVFKLRSKMKPI